MFKKLDPRINLALTLAIIAGVSALMLSLVNDITAPVIAENREKQTLELYSELFEDMTDFEEVDASKADSLIVVKNGQEEIGTICAASGMNGYGSITALFGFDLEDNIVGVQYSNFNQTPGFGDKVSDPEYGQTQYVGDNASNVDADVASGATYSSKLVFELAATCAEEVKE